VYERKIDGRQIVKNQIDISNKSKGIYILSIESEKVKAINKRILVK